MNVLDAMRLDNKRAEIGTLTGLAFVCTEGRILSTKTYGRTFARTVCELLVRAGYSADPIPSDLSPALARVQVTL